MARPPLPLGTWGTITTEKIRGGSYRALTRFRDSDGNTRRVTATGPSKAAAERALRDVLGTHTAPAGELITAETRLIDLANLWITGLEAEGRIEQTTINEYRRVLDNLVLPSAGGLKLREATTGRLDRRLLRLRDQSVNRQRKGQGGPRGPRGRTPVGQRGPSRTQGHRRHGRHHRPDARHRVPHWRDPRLALERPESRRGSSHPHGVRHDQDRDGERYLPEGHTEVGHQRADRGAPPVRHRAAPGCAGSSRPNPNDAVFATRNGTWHQVVNVERRWRQIRKDTGLDWVTPHTFRKTVATLISERVDAETASQQLGHSSPAITREFYISKPAIAADVAHVLEELARPEDDRVAARILREYVAE